MTATGEVFSWVSDTSGQCGHSESDDIIQLLPRRVDATTEVRACSASAGGQHSLDVTDTGTLHSFGILDFRQHRNNNSDVPKIPDLSFHNP